MQVAARRLTGKQGCPIMDLSLNVLVTDTLSLDLADTALVDSAPSSPCVQCTYFTLISKHTCMIVFLCSAL